MLRDYRDECVKFLRVMGFKCISYPRSWAEWEYKNRNNGDGTKIFLDFESDLSYEEWLIDLKKEFEKKAIVEIRQIWKLQKHIKITRLLIATVEKKMKRLNIIGTN